MEMYSCNLAFAFLITIASISAISLCSNGNHVEVACKESERQALLKFKQDLIDPMNRLSTWDTGDQSDCCSWTGVGCDNLTGHVRELHLGFPHQNLEDSDEYLSDLKYKLGVWRCSPYQLGNLSSLRYLDLSSSDLKVENLQWLSNLSLLQHLEMSFVDLSKAFDSIKVINMLHSLQSLRLSTCELRNSAPLSIINSTSLVTLDLSSNRLGPVIPKWIFSLTHLVSLNLGSNYFQGPIPFGLSNMTRLEILVLSRNSFNSTIPHWMMFRFYHLDSLNLMHNELVGNIPSAIQNLTSITSFSLLGNQLEGEIPKSLGNLCKLRELELSINKFSGGETFQSLSGCAVDSLELLDLEDNQLSGQLSYRLGLFKNLVSLSASDNLLSGPIPMSIGKMSCLQHFDISHNQLNGSLPESFGQLVRLEVLDMSNNLFNGVVSEVHFANLTRLKVLYAFGNSLTLKASPHWLPPFQLEKLSLNSWDLGIQFPRWIRSQRRLSELQISSTGISDTIPSWFCNFAPKLDYLNLSLNQFQGEFRCANQYSLSTIDLSSNQFNGSLPLISSNMVILDFSNNSFSGSVFHFFCGENDQKNSSLEQWTSYIDLGNNLLSGALPNCWMKWEYLGILNLQNNNLFGVIPSSMGYLFGLFFLNLRNNSLSGELPSSLQNCTTLNALDLSENRFVGKIPKWIGTSFPKLFALNLRSNKFHGDIPLEFCNLTELQIMDLALNNITGTIPRCFYNLSAMTKLDYSFGPFTLFFSKDMYNLIAKAVVVTKGREAEYSSALNLVAAMDLSSNNLSGEIPTEITRLLHLQTLNLSGNHLTGKLSPEIGDMKWLESLDLSRNQLSGEIPPSISSLTFLSHLNLSYNNFSGRIPTGTQLQSLDESDFIGNQLCGPPLHVNCSATNEDVAPGPQQGGEDNILKQNYLYLSLGLGFASGFWCVLGSLLFNVPWNIAFNR
ncbi:hypothetical protein FNV43_RR21944 [Rhamnella rubrinervis]|uniref:Leucine-rich repeat-containing N-terminal plant-type domain-containing protein n=1 Tax=Rhamnella rubrinervis TaxID=2594499 RepID=A0A8K0E0Z9_9ROSA|nr:hypothetical protein FNV43_RR21944 [Rhamnella rubrinervis]